MEKSIKIECLPKKIEFVKLCIGNKASSSESENPETIELTDEIISNARSSICRLKSFIENIKTEINKYIGLLSKQRNFFEVDKDIRKYEESPENADLLKEFREKLNNFKEKLESYDSDFFEELNKTINDINSIFSIRKISGVVPGRFIVLDDEIKKFVRLKSK